MDSSAHEGGGVSQVEEPEGDEPTEYRPRGLWNDSARVSLGSHAILHTLPDCLSSVGTKL